MDREAARIQKVPKAIFTHQTSYDRRFSDAKPADRRAAVNLVQFASRESDLGLNGNAVQTLIYSLNVRSPRLSKFDDVSTDMRCSRANHRMKSLTA